MKHKRDISKEQSVTSNGTATPNEDLESLQLKVSLPSTWGLGERLVPDQMASDPASQRIVELNFRHYEIASRYVSGKRVLDIACGTGYGSQILSLAGASTVVGVDACSSTIRYAQQRYQTAGVKFICSDAEQFEWSEQFDVVVSFETIEHLRHPDKFLDHIRRLLVSEGDFLLSVPLGETRHFDPYHLHAFTQEEVFALLEKVGFSVELYRCDDLFLSRSDLNHWEGLYPEAPKPSIYELLFTPRGRQVMRDFIFRGGLQIPQLLVTARTSNRSMND
jgi:2-polyprenyl-3-methyl-5-hydroxy-6-metoxy-1,4-benzoquinol methylase